MYCIIIPRSAPFIICYLICNSKMNLNLIASCLLFLMLQAIKVLNMIKLYGKPIRVNKVRFLFPCYVSALLYPGYKARFKLICELLFGGGGGGGGWLCGGG
jgi:hypothetical protein